MARRYFVAISILPKGRRLLRRAIPLLVPEFALPIFGLIFRNIGALQLADQQRSEKEQEETRACFHALAVSIVGLNKGADPMTHSSLVNAITTRFPGDFLPRVLGSQIGASLYVICLPFVVCFWRSSQ